MTYDGLFMARWLIQWIPNLYCSIIRENFEHLPAPHLCSSACLMCPSRFCGPNRALFLNFIPYIIYLYHLQSVHVYGSNLAAKMDDSRLSMTSLWHCYPQRPEPYAFITNTLMVKSTFLIFKSHFLMAETILLRVEGFKSWFWIVVEPSDQESFQLTQLTP